jgi:hypothetical protein
LITSFGLARNARLEAETAAEMAQARAAAERSGQTVRRFKDFRWSTRDSWSHRRRVIGKAERTQGEGNPRFIVTSLGQAKGAGRWLYETIYCARGEMENRIKQCQLDLFADRTSAASMAANQLRLWFASFAYVLLCGLRQIGLTHTQFATATCGTIRLKRLKIGRWCEPVCAGSAWQWRPRIRGSRRSHWHTHCCDEPRLELPRNRYREAP